MYLALEAHPIRNLLHDLNHEWIDGKGVFFTFAFADVRELFCFEIHLMSGPALLLFILFCFVLLMQILMKCTLLTYDTRHPDESNKKIHKKILWG